MSATGTRPPLFDPDPDDHSDGATRFPLQRNSKRGGRSGGSGKGQSSPAWVRPFIFGGLILIAIISLYSIFVGEDESPADDVATAPDGQAESGEGNAEVGAPAAGAAGDVDDGAAGEAEGGDTPVDQAQAEGSAAAVDASADVATADQQDMAGAGDDAMPPPDASAGATGVTEAGITDADAFAVQFAHDYLNFDEANPEVRRRELQSYLAPGLDAQLGWDGQGTQLAVLTIPVESRTLDDRTIVTVAAQVTGSDAPRWVHLDVPLVADGAGRWAVVDQPAFVPRPAAGSPSLEDSGPPVDAELSGQLQSRMTQLFTAFADEPTVEVDGVTAPDAAIRGLNGQVALAEVGDLAVHAGDADQRSATIAVSWLDEVTGATLNQRYALTLVADAGDWLIQDITAR